MPTILKGMKCTFQITPFLVKMKYEDHDLLAFTDCTMDPFEERTILEEDLMMHTPHEWALGLDKSGLLGLIHMPHFGRLTEANACAKQ